MSYVSTRLGEQVVCDADSHLMESPDWLRSYAEADVRALIGDSPWIVDVPVGVVDQLEPWVKELLYTSFNIQTRDDRIELANRQLMEEKTYRALGAVDPAERPLAVDLLGVKRQLVFSSASISQFYWKSAGARCDADPKLLYGGTRAHNRGMVDFCSVDERLIPVGFVPLEEPTESVKVLDEALSLGCGAINVSHAPPEERSWSHPDYDPFWARLAEARVPMMLHIGAGEQAIGLPKSVYNNGRPTFYTHGDKTWQIPDVVAWNWLAELMLTQLVIDGTFERFPDLRCGVAELRASWVPSFLGRLDMAQEAAHQNPGYAEDRRLPMRASDYIRRQVKFTPWAPGGDDLASMIQIEGGERLFMFSSDWPHPEGGTDPIGGFEAEFEKLSGRSDVDDLRDRFYRGNFDELFGTTDA